MLEQLEEYISVGRGIEAVIKDKEELVLIDTIFQTFQEAESTFKDEQIRLSTEIERLIVKVEKAKLAARRTEPIEVTQARIKEIENERTHSVKHISTLQEEKMQIDKRIAEIRKSVDFSTEKAIVEGVSAEIIGLRQKLRFIMNVFNNVNFDFESPQIQGYIADGENVQHFCYEQTDQNLVEVTDAMWDLL